MYDIVKLSVLFLVAATCVTQIGIDAHGEPPKSLNEKSQEQRRRVEEHQRKVQEKIEATRRRLNANDSKRPQLPTPSSRPRDAVSQPKKLPQNFKYAFNERNEFAYAFSLQFTSAGKAPIAQDLAGIAVFQATENSGGRWEIVARDNIKPSSSSSSEQPIFPGQKTTLLSRAFKVSGTGDEPRLDGDLPALLGSIEDWFFPPMPPIVQAQGGQRGAGTAVVRTDTGRWRDVGFYNPNDPSARGYYEWEVTPIESSNGMLKAEEKRTFRNRIGSLELTGRGTLTFDVKKGILIQRSFRATFTEGGVPATISLDVMATDPSKLPR